jgi:thiamine-monophosphate kinase
VVDERTFTASLARFFGKARGLSVGIGDDAAVVRMPGRDVVLCCDPVVEGVHFTRTDDPALVGRKVVNRNLSDVAAMGARPCWLLLSLVLPRGYPAAQRRRLLLGVRSAARAGGCTVVGGDVASTRGPLVVTVTAVGHPGPRVLRRDGARAGDLVHVTAPLGGSRAGHHLRFRPALAEGAWLARSGVVSAAMDVSDGLLLDLATLLAASGGRGAELDADAIPVAAAARRAARGDRRRALAAALADGEDHALLFTVRRHRVLPGGGPLRACARRPIGRVLARPGLWLVHADGRRERVRAAGWQHEL